MVKNISYALNNSPSLTISNSDYKLKATYKNLEDKENEERANYMA